METPLRKLFRQFLAKAIIALAGLLVVAPQISYKFYLYANFPSASFKARHRSPQKGPLADAAASRLAHERHHHLSIDKRYTVKHVFAVPSTPFALSGEPGSRVTPALPFHVAVSDPLLSDRRLRGPPIRSALSFLI